MNPVAPHPTGGKAPARTSPLGLRLVVSNDTSGRLRVTPTRSDAPTIGGLHASGRSDAFPEVTARPHPFTSVTVEQVTIPIWRTRWRDKKRRKTYVSYTLAWRDATGRHREKRSDLVAAKSRAEQVAIAINNGDIALLQFSHADRAQLQRSRELVAPTGQPLEVAAGIYAQIVQILEGRDPIQAAREWAATNPVGVIQRNIPDIIAELLSKRIVVSSGKKWARMIGKMLDRFGRHFTGPLQSVQARDIEDWLDGLRSSRSPRSPRSDAPTLPRLGLRTRHNYHAAIEALVRYAADRGYVPKGWSIMDAVSDPDVPHAPVNLYTPDELVRLLTRAESTRAGRKLVPLIAITAFAGVRHGEMNEEKIEALDWSELDFEAKAIYVTRGAAKTGRDRVVDMPENLIAWLLPYRRPSGKICVLKNTSNALCRLRKSAGVLGPKKNALRKSFISYQLALTRNIEGVADQAGNSRGIIIKNYKRSDTRLRAAAARWFQIVPQRADVLPLFEWAKAS